MGYVFGRLKPVFGGRLKKVAARLNEILQNGKNVPQRKIIGELANIGRGIATIPPDLSKLFNRSTNKSHIC
jgi:hypothetical protein